jgi:uncharacterized protein (TIGR03437 family)
MKNQILLLFLLSFTFTISGAVQNNKVVDIYGRGIPDVTVSRTCTFQCPGTVTPLGTNYFYFYPTNSEKSDSTGGFVLPPWPSSPCANGVASACQFSLSKPGFIFTQSSTTGTYVGTDHPLLNLSAASYDRNNILTGGMIVSAFGTNLAIDTTLLNTASPSLSLAGKSIKIRDSYGKERFAQVNFVSPSQINYLLPPVLPEGTAVIMLMDGMEITHVGFTTISRIAPGFFSADSSGQGIAAGFIQRLSASGVMTYEQLAEFSGNQNKFVALPIDLSVDTDKVFLALYGTGFRNRASLADIKISIGGIPVEVLYAGPQIAEDGLDQVNVLLPRSLIGKGDVDVVVENYGTNKVSIKLK